MITITLDGTSGVIATFDEIERRTERAAVRALNRAIGSGRTVMVREIARDIGLKSRDVRDAIRLTEATSAKLEASIAASMKRIPLFDFLPGSGTPRGPYPSRGRRLLRIRGKSYHGAFVARMPSGHWGVFSRRGRTRLPIDELKGPSLGHVFRKYKPLGLERAKEAFLSNFKHEVRYQGASGA